MLPKNETTTKAKLTIYVAKNNLSLTKSTQKKSQNIVKNQRSDERNPECNTKDRKKADDVTSLSSKSNNANAARLITTTQRA